MSLTQKASGIASKRLHCERSGPSIDGQDLQSSTTFDNKANTGVYIRPAILGL